MNALVSFRKETGRPPVFTFRRSDGSTVWSKLGSLPIEYDLAHYVAEKSLGFTQAFFGLLDEGFAIEDFDLPRGKRPTALLPANLPLESLQIEYIVNLLQTEQRCGPSPEFRALLTQGLTTSGLPYPDQLTEDVLNQIREDYQTLIEKWYSLPDGQQLDLALVIIGH